MLKRSFIELRFIKPTTYGSSSPVSGMTTLFGSPRIRATAADCLELSMSGVNPSTTIAHHAVWLTEQQGQVRGLMTPNKPIRGG